MKNFTLIALSLAVFSIFTFSVSQTSFAQCEVTGMTDDGGEIVLCDDVDPDGIETTPNNDEVTIEEGADLFSTREEGTVSTLEGDDKVVMNGGKIDNNFNPGNPDEGGEGIGTEDGADEVIFRDGLINATRDCIHTSDGNDRVIVEGGRLECQDDAIDLGADDDLAIIIGGILIGDEDGITAGSGNDRIETINTFIKSVGTGDSDPTSENAIEGNAGNDIVAIGSNVRIEGTLNGGEDVDTLIFNMNVPAPRIEMICSELEASDPAQGSIIINGLSYSWLNFETISCDLVPGEVSAVPTISQWGLIVTVSSLFILAVFMLHRRNKAARL